ncbi:MAG: SRPBCC family protein [Longimicrobiales bacterium]
MKAWIAPVLWVVALTVGTVWLFGVSVPRDHTATVTDTIAAPLDSVWAVVTAPSGFPSWRSGVSSVEVLPPEMGRPRWRESGSDGTLTLEATAWSPPTRFVTRIADEGLPFGGTWVYELAPVGVGTRVTLTENGQIYSPFYRFVAQFFLGYEATMRTYLDDLHRRFDG